MILTFNGKFMSRGLNKVLGYESAPDYNPLGLPPYTLRVRYAEGTSPNVTYSGATAVEVTGQPNVWDITLESSDWSQMFAIGPNAYQSNANLLEVLGANSTGVTDMHDLFQSTSITTLPLFDTTQVTDMHWFVGQCLSLVSFPAFDCSHVTNMNNMFRGDTSLVTVEFNDTRNVTAMGSMFRGCTALRSVQGLNTAAATVMDFLFSGCTSLEDIPTLDLSGVTNASYMFDYCGSLESITLINTSSVTNMEHICESCTSLTDISIDDMSHVQNLFYAFHTCSSLRQIPLFNLASATDTRIMFAECRNVESGALALYQQTSSQANPPDEHSAMFLNCGADTVSGAAELEQIPFGWKNW